AVFGAHGALGGEEIGAHGGIQQIHAAGEVARHRLEPGGVAVKHVGADLQLAHHALEHAGAEGGDVVGGAVIHQGEQQLLGQYVDLQGLAALGDGGMPRHGGDAPAGADGEVVAVLGGAQGAAGAHGGDVRVVAHVGLKDVVEGQVHRQIAA